MQVDFYQLGGIRAEALLPQIVAKCFDRGERLLVVAAQGDARSRLSQALWEYRREPFLAHGFAGDAYEEQQPVLLSAEALATNGASILVLADGQWREEADDFARVCLFFDETTLGDARARWRALASRDGLIRRFWKRDAGRWVAGP